ncbi:hypothetical protein HKX48_003435 [Thoreauomyces humboldtii]|nr:hypothetical protein HKX48_003435 [Thoreauomyces humboldtii]
MAFDADAGMDSIMDVGSIHDGSGPNLYLQSKRTQSSHAGDSPMGMVPSMDENIKFASSGSDGASSHNRADPINLPLESETSAGDALIELWRKNSVLAGSSGKFRRSSSGRGPTGRVSTAISLISPHHKTALLRRLIQSSSTHYERLPLDKSTAKTETYNATTVQPDD